MGFRNPVTTLSASRITPGTLPPGVQLPADQVTTDTGTVAGALGELVDGLTTVDGHATDAQAAAADAHDAAAAAQTTADTAQTTADTANMNASVALATANGRNTVTWSTSTPAAPGTAVGDVWFRFSGAIVIGQWRWSGAGWVAATLGDAVLATLTAGKITTGALAAGVVVTAGTPGGARVELTATGLKAYAANGTTVLMDLTGGAATFSGAVTGATITGGLLRTAAAGNRVEIDHANSAGEIRLYGAGDTPARLRAYGAGGVGTFPYVELRGGQGNAGEAALVMYQDYAATSGVERVGRLEVDRAEVTGPLTTQPVAVAVASTVYWTPYTGYTGLTVRRDGGRVYLDSTTLRRATSDSPTLAAGATFSVAPAGAIPLGMRPASPVRADGVVLPSGSVLQFCHLVVQPTGAIDAYITAAMTLVNGSSWVGLPAMSWTPTA